MLIDIESDIATIQMLPSELRSHHINQIKYWGFIRETHQNSYRLSSTNLEHLLPKLLKYLDKEGIKYSVTPACQKYFSAITKKRENFEIVRSICKEYKDGRFDTDKFGEFAEFINKNIRRKLKSHQIKASYHLYLLGNGANFSVPGSGKTTVVLTAYEKLKCESKVNLLFIVGPPSCFGPWRTEFEETFGRKPKWRILAGGDQAARKSEYFSPYSKNAELYLTTFQTLLNDQEEVITFLQRKDTKAFLVIDEAHYVKQINGNWANAVLGISEHAKYRCVLTGTPLPKSYSDIFNLFDFLWPDDEPIDSTTKIKIQLKEESHDETFAKETLKTIIGPLFYRVRKSELGLMPPVFHPPIVLDMNKYERLLYDAIENKIRNYSKEDYLKNIDLVRKLRRGRILRLRQCSSYIRLLSTAVENYNEELVEDKADLLQIIYGYDDLEIPAKLEYLKKFIIDLQKNRQKVVIWANFINTLKLIRDHLTNTGCYCKLIYGDTPIEQTSLQGEESREKIRDEFVDPNSGLDILIANPAACAESISLHKTCYNAIYYDLSYNCAQYLQSLDRIHRVGGSETHQANYYFLQYANTIDNDIKGNLERKAQKMYDLIEEDYGVYSMDMFAEDDEVEAYERLFGKQ
jgi:SNF2 family DNA or RNA helicase